MEEILRLTGQVGAVQATVTHLQGGQAEIKADLNGKHQQNRDDIHALRGQMQGFVDDITKRISKIEVKVAVGSAIGGMLFALGSKAIDHFWK